MDGGGHERGLRSGTLPVPLVVGFGAACALAGDTMADEAGRVRELRDRLHAGLRAALPDCRLNGHPDERLPNNLNLSFPHVHGEALLMALNRTVAVSSGSACTSASVEPSYVLRAMGVPDELAHASIRFGLGRFTTADEMEYVIDEVPRVVRHLRSLSPDYQLACAAPAS
jgi:cysteine desulfurase